MKQLVFLDNQVVKSKAREKKGAGKKSGGEPRAKSAGEPKEKPTSYALGTRRRGTDGAMWEVAYVRENSRTEGWVPVVDDAAPMGSFNEELPSSHSGGGRRGARDSGRGSGVRSRSGKQKGRKHNAVESEMNPQQASPKQSSAEGVGDEFSDAALTNELL